MEFPSSEQRDWDISSPTCLRSSLSDWHAMFGSIIITTKYYPTPWRNGSASDSRSEGCVFKSRRGQCFTHRKLNSLYVNHATSPHFTLPCFHCLFTAYATSPHLRVIYTVPLLTLLSLSMIVTQPLLTLLSLYDSHTTLLTLLSLYDCYTTSPHLAITLLVTQPLLTLLSLYESHTTSSYLAISVW